MRCLLKCIYDFITKNNRTFFIYEYFFIIFYNYFPQNYYPGESIFMDYLPYATLRIGLEK